MLQWYRNSPALVNVNWKNEFAVAGINLQFESADVAYGQENEIMNEANELIAAANAVNITDANISQFNDEFDDNSGVGYYDPPYSYAQCLTVFTKEMCDFRFNSDWTMGLATSSYTNSLGIGNMKMIFDPED